MRNIQIKVLKYEELNEEGKRKALQQHVDSTNEFSFLLDDANKTLEKFADIFKITLKSWGIYSPIIYNLNKYEEEQKELSRYREENKRGKIYFS